MKVLRFIFGLPLAIIILVPYVLFIMVRIFVTSIYGSIRYKEPFIKIWAELYNAFTEGIRIGIDEIKTSKN